MTVFLVLLEEASLESPYGMEPGLLEAPPGVDASVELVDNMNHEIDPS